MERLEHPERKSMRLRGFDYRNTNAYFVTICTHERAPLLSAVRDGRVELTQLGAIAEWCWFDLPQHYGFVELDAFVVMPDHVHALIGLGVGHPNKGAERRPPVSEVVRAFKTESTRRINNVRSSRGAPVWQRSFYDHIIRDDADLERVREYIADLRALGQTLWRTTFRRYAKRVRPTHPHSSRRRRAARHGC